MSAKLVSVVGEDLSFYVKLGWNSGPQEAAFKEYKCMVSCKTTVEYQWPPERSNLEISTRQ